MPRGIRAKTYTYVLRRSLTAPVTLVATQMSRRTQRQGKPTYWYGYLGDVYYSHSERSAYLIPAGYDEQSMQRYRDVFLLPPLTDSERQWLEINGIDIVTGDNEQ